MARKVYEIARELNCSEDELLKFLNHSGILCNDRYSLVSDRGYNLARANVSRLKSSTTTFNPPRDELADLRRAKESVERRLATVINEKSSVETERNDLRRQLTDLRSETISVERERDTLKRQLEIVRNEKISVERQLSKVRAENFSVETLCDELKHRLETVRAEKTAVEQQRDDLSRQLAYVRIDKESLEAERDDLQSELDELRRAKASADYRTLLEQFDTAAIGKSAIKYFDAVLSVTDELLDVVDEYEAAQSETLAEFAKIEPKLNAKFVGDANLTAKEKILLSERQNFLAARLDPNLGAVKEQITTFKEQAEEFFTRLDEMNFSTTSIRELAELQAEPRADFELLVENLSRVVREAQRRVNFFARNKNFVASVVDSHVAWTDAYKSFVTDLQENFSADEDDDWRSKRFAVEQKFLPLVEFWLKGNLSNDVESILKLLQDYRDAVDEFYLHGREGEDPTEKFRHDLQEIISSRGTAERKFLLKWSASLLNENS